MVREWKFSQTTGLIFCETLEVLTHGYSGSGAGKNNHNMQEVVGVGPIPCGWYTVGGRQETPSPISYRLIPDAGTKTFNRSGFMVHGDSIAEPGSASHGCIVADRVTRVQLREGDRVEVTP